MGREIRRVPEDWKHPKDENGNYIPLFEHNFTEILKDWRFNFKMWIKGKVKDYGSKINGAYKLKENNHKNTTFDEYFGEMPQKKDYMPEFKESELTHIQMYETCSEGTPISPVAKTPEKLAQWLVDNKASACGDMTASYDAWLRICKGGYACSIITKNGKLMSGVEGLKDN